MDENTLISLPQPCIPPFFDPLKGFTIFDKIAPL